MGNDYDESVGDKASVTILATGFIHYHNKILKEKPEPEKFNLVRETGEETNTELNVDNWFYKNFGLVKVLEEDSD